MDEALLCDTVAIQQRGQIIAVDTPRNLLARGRVRLTLDYGARQERQEIGGQPTDLAAALHPHGLSDDIRAVSIDADTLETVVVLGLAGKGDVGV
ncbi:MAG: hypothetical protein U0232_21880 [Thermomicrobiales bacterium]